MIHIHTFFGLLVFSVALTNSTVIKFSGTLQADTSATQEKIEACSTPDSPSCQEFEKSVCNTISSIINGNTIKGLQDCTASIRPDAQKKTGSIDVQLNFMNPKLQQEPLDLECSVFYELLKASIFQLEKSITLSNVKIIEPQLRPFGWQDKTATFQVSGYLLENKNDFPPKMPDSTTDKLVQECMEKLIIGSQFSSPLYARGKMVLSNVQYIIENKVKVVFNVIYNTTDLKISGLDPTCTAFAEFLQYGIQTSQSTCKFTLGQPVTVALKEIPTDSSATTTIHPGSQSTTTNTATAVQGRKHLYLFTCIGLFTAHFMPSI